MRRQRRDTKGVVACVAGLGCVALGALAYTGPEAFADGDPATSHVLAGELILPYDAHLQIDAQDANGVLRVRFELFEAPTGGAPEWSEEQGVSLVNGNLSVGLGAVVPLTTTLLDAQRLWLGITVLEDDGQGGTVELPLAGRQAIEPTPFAAWSAHAADFSVASSARVAGEVLTGSDVLVGGEVRVRGGDLHLGTANGAGLGDGGHALTHDTSTDTLRFNVGGSFTGGSVLEGARVEVTGALNVLGDATLGPSSGEVVLSGNTAAGALEFDGDVTLSSGATLTGAHTIQGSTGVRFEGGLANSGALELDGAGNLVATGDLEVTGRLVLARDTPRRFTDIGTYDLGMREDEGFCYLGEVMVFYTRLPSETQCAVRLDGSDAWELEVSKGSSGSDFAACTAHCVRY